MNDPRTVLGVSWAIEALVLVDRKEGFDVHVVEGASTVTVD